MVVKAMMIQTFELIPSSSSSLAAGTLVEAGIIVLLVVGVVTLFSKSDT